MPKKGKDSHRDLTLPEFGRVISEKLKLSNLYHSGELDLLRTLSKNSTGVNWRILRYQHILDPEKSTIPISQFSYVTPATFEKHLKQLKRECNLVYVDDLMHSISKNENIPDKTVAVTIDGGWMDLFLHAFPIIRDQNVPVSAFLPTYFIDSFHLPWSDKAVWGFLNMRDAGQTFEPFDFFSNELKDIFYEVSPDGEITLPAIAVMIAGLKEAPPHMRQVALAVLGQITHNLGAPIPNEQFFLRWEEVVMMERFGVRFGSLGHKLRPYHEMTEYESRQDFVASWEELNHRLQAPMKILAAPEGVINHVMASLLIEHDFPGVLLADHAPDHFVLQKTVFAPRRITIYDALTRSPELFFCKIWDIPLEQQQDA